MTTAQKRDLAITGLENFFKGKEVRNKKAEVLQQVLELLKENGYDVFTSNQVNLEENFSIIIREGKQDYKLTMSAAKVGTNYFTKEDEGLYFRTEEQQRYEDKKREEHYAEQEKRREESDREYRRRNA